MRKHAQLLVRNFPMDWRVLRIVLLQNLGRWASFEDTATKEREEQRNNDDCSDGVQDRVVLSRGLCLGLLLNILHGDLRRGGGGDRRRDDDSLRLSRGIEPTWQCCDFRLTSLFTAIEEVVNLAAGPIHNRYDK